MNVTIDFESARYRMIARDIVARGIRDREVIAAFAAVPRERFLPPSLEHLAYSDPSVLIDRGVDESPPHVLAAMMEGLELEGWNRVLEVGAGSGYGAAVLSRIVGEVYTVEGNIARAESARARLLEAEFDNVSVRYGEGALGWEEYAPFDAIMVSAGGPAVSESLREQLAVGGRLIVPAKRFDPETLIRERRCSNRSIERETLTVTRLLHESGQENRQP